MRSIIITSALLLIFLFPSLAMAGWNIEDYPVGKKVSYQPGKTYHLELLPIHRNDEVDRIAGGRLPSQYYSDLLTAVFSKKTAKIADTRGKMFNLLLRHVSPFVARVLPVLDVNDRVIGHITPSAEGADWLRYDGISLLGPIGIVTPTALWSGKNPGFEVRTDFVLYHNPAGGHNVQSEAGAVKNRITRQVSATTLCLITN